MKFLKNILNLIAINNHEFRTENLDEIESHSVFNKVNERFMGYFHFKF